MWRSEVTFGVISREPIYLEFFQGILNSILCVWVCTCLLYVHCTCAVPVKARKGCHLPLELDLPDAHELPFWCWKLNLDPLEDSDCSSLPNRPSSPHLVFWDRVSLTVLMPADWAGLANQYAPGILLLLPPRDRNHRCALPCLATLTWLIWINLESPCLQGGSFAS